MRGSKQPTARIDATNRDHDTLPGHDAPTMARQLRVELTFLSTLQQVAGRSTLWLEVPPGASVDRLLALLRERHPQFQGVDMQTNVNGLPVTGRLVLAQGDGLFLLPPG